MADSGRESEEKLELVGIGSMVLDRMHRTRRVLGPNEKGLLDEVESGGPVQTCIGGVLLNQAGWAALFGTRVGLFGRQADDEAGRTLRAAMKQAGIETHLNLTGSASSLAEIFVDAEGERVRQGDLLFELYSPELVNAQKEYLQARRRGEAQSVLRVGEPGRPFEV